MQTVQIQGRNCHIYGAAGAQFLLVQLVDDHDMQGMEAELAALSAACRSPFLLAAVPVEVWNDALSPWPAPPVWGRQGFGGGSAGTLDFLLRQLLPALKQQFALPADVHIILGGYSLAGLFALWAATQSSAFCGIAAASPSVWFPGWNGYEAAHPVQTSCVYLSLGDREEHTKTLPWRRSAQTSARCTSGCKRAAPAARWSGTQAGISKSRTCAPQRLLPGPWRTANDDFD